ncbi:TRAM LAG1 CLN8-like proteiny domain containing protein [Aphelenchoides bicaudatus]|nr:TRAM LAG1 CLN8-like proteiny domain containing protein [Aphelenchoides bicaudatus]
MSLIDWEAFWKKDYWLPRRDTWDDVPTKIDHLWAAFYFAIPILLLRIFIEVVVGLQLGKWFGFIPESLSEARRQHIFGGFASQTKRKKVLECFWRFTSYSMLFALGYYILKDKGWLYDTHKCFVGYPRHQIEPDVWFYYMVECGFYIGLLFCSIFDTRRSDFWEMNLHHLITFSLLSFSWTVNFVRVGTLILISHDISDIFLELAKLFRYNRKYPFMANTAFVVFMFSWIITRLIYFPFFVVYVGIRDGPALIQPDYEVFNFKQVPYAPRILLVLLLCLMGLHIFWTILIFKIVARTLRSGEAADVRSDSEETDGEVQTTEQKKKLLKTRKELDQKKKVHGD